jgi:hypothetical protein
VKIHPSEAELALLAGGECGWLTRLRLRRHVRNCESCGDAVAEFQDLRGAVSAAGAELPGISDAEWDRMALEMRANIHLGLEAGACVPVVEPARVWNPKLAAAFASLLILAGAGLTMRGPVPVAPTALKADVPTVQSSLSGLEVRTGDTSLTLLNHHGSVADQTASAQGTIRASYVDAGGVTINNVYLE